MIFWIEKDSATSAEQATEAIADFLSSSEGIAKAQNDRLDEIEAYAHKWGVPFDRKLISTMIGFQSKKRWGGDGALQKKDKTDEELFELFKIDCSDDFKEENEIVVNLDDVSNIVSDWFDDWKYEYCDTSHSWQSSSESC